MSFHNFGFLVFTNAYHVDIITKAVLLQHYVNADFQNLTVSRKFHKLLQNPNFNENESAALEFLSTNDDDPSCSRGTLMFVGQRLLTYEQRFEIVMDVFSLGDCLKLCWDSKCSRAAFTRFPKATCLMHFEENKVSLRSACPNVRLHELASDWMFASIPEVVEIQCIKCGERNQH